MCAGFVPREAGERRKGWDDAAYDRAGGESALGAVEVARIRRLLLTGARSARLAAGVSAIGGARGSFPTARPHEDALAGDFGASLPIHPAVSYTTSTMAEPFGHPELEPTVA